ncbi:hypothetical protein [Sulfobacillus harzensis]|uniref:Uncharacterized protein n=1 Tax=Sulfobacillus harzensis TaxID=2729629 RepID=A0A7Y0Q148_9FIRM|nr:hypothetical protein [Sulfobacillus harzensis]NMP20930.1 hypothetical protein [Sulfobacillus harzensis]
MRARSTHAPGWIRILGSVMIVMLPVVAASLLHASRASWPTPLVFVLTFLVVGLAAQLGLIVRRWGNINIGRLLFDALLLAVSGLIAWAVVDIAMHRGGGPVDPSLVAIIMAYILAIWSGQHP